MSTFDNYAEKTLEFCGSNLYKIPLQLLYGELMIVVFERFDFNDC